MVGLGVVGLGVVGKPLAALEEMGSAGFARLASRDPSLVVKTVSDSACLGKINRAQGSK